MKDYVKENNEQLDIEAEKRLVEGQFAEVNLCLNCGEFIKDVLIDTICKECKPIVTLKMGSLRVS